MIEKLFTSKNRVKIIKFLLFDKSKTYTREVSNMLKIPVSAVKGEIDNLAKINLVTVNKGKIELNKNCTILIDLKNIFLKTDYLYEPIKDAFRNMPIKFAIIFGSFASGKDDFQSDVDLLVISELKQDKIFNSLRSAEKAINREINVINWSKETLISKKENALIKDIKKKGYLVITGDENEFRKIIE